MDGQVDIYRQGDREIILNYIEGFKNLTNEEFVVKVNDFSQKGLFGVHQQGLFFIALLKECKNRGLISPLKVEGNNLLICQDAIVPEKTRMIDVLQSKGIKLVKKTGTFIMPVSSKLASKWNSKTDED